VDREPSRTPTSLLGKREEKVNGKKKSFIAMQEEKRRGIANSNCTSGRSLTFYPYDATRLLLRQKNKRGEEEHKERGEGKRGKELSFIGKKN